MEEHSSGALEVKPPITFLAAKWYGYVLAGVFFAIAAVGGIAGGWLASRLMGRGWSVNAARKVCLLICALAVVPVFLAPDAGQCDLSTDGGDEKGVRPPHSVGYVHVTSL